MNFDLFVGKSSSDPGESPFIHIEKDFEVASRSADSTEDSLPDQLSPETADKSGKKKFKYSKSEGDQAESGDYLSASSTESLYTSSDDLSSDAEDVEGDKEKAADRERQGFVPINIPDINTETVEERKNIVKVEGRRCKSEGDKNLLVLEEFPREGSTSKFKPDGSWIKPASESESDLNSKDEDNIDVESELSTDKTDDGGGLWMGAKPDNEIKDKNIVSTEEEQRHISDAQNKTDSEQTVEESSDPYVRENIPWNPGKVQQQKKDIEDKYGTSVFKKRESVESTEEKTQIVKKTETSLENEGKVISEVTDKEMKDNSKSVSDSEDCSTKNDQCEAVEIDQGADNEGVSVEMKKSVYEEEDIDLPEGIVRKTTMEIEERNR